MRTTIDAAGRIVVPQGLRDELGFSAGVELQLEAVDGRLQIAVPSRVRVEDAPHGVRLAAGAADSVSTEVVRRIIERGRR